MGIGSTIGNALDFASQALQVSGLSSAAQSASDSMTQSQIGTSMDEAKDESEMSIAEGFESMEKQAASMTKSASQPAS